MRHSVSSEENATLHVEHVFLNDPPRVILGHPTRTLEFSFRVCVHHTIVAETFETKPDK